MLIKSLKKAKVSLLITVISMAISSFSLCLIPFSDGIGVGESDVLDYTISVLLWLGFIVAIAATHYTKVTLEFYRKKLIGKKFISNQKLPGIVSFSAEAKRIAIYSAIVAGAAIMITDMIFNYVSEIVMLLITSVTVLLFALHCVIDGKYYKVYKLIKENLKNETDH